MDAIKEAVQQKYGEAALQARSGAQGRMRMRDILLWNGSDHVESL